MFDRLLIPVVAFGLLAFPLPVLAKEKAKAEHPMKRVDVRPNDEDEDIWTLTLESNIYRNNLYLDPVLDFSSHSGWDVQIAAYNVPVWSQGTRGDWDSFVNLSKTFAFGELYKLVLGTQNGTGFAASSHLYQNFDYGLMVWQPVGFLNLHVGPYFANAALAGVGNVPGFAAGFSVDLLEDVVTLQGDYFSGHAGMSGAIVNLFVTASPGIQAYIGLGVPEQNSGSEFYGIFGFSVSSQSF